MKRLRYTLLADGSSDRALMPILSWAIRDRGYLIEQEAWADFSYLPQRSVGLRDRAKAAVEHYPCDVLFIHRDAEAEPWNRRLAEIRDAVRPIGCLHVCVIPVRMTEAWLLHDETAIRRTSGNPNGTMPLNLPNVSDVETLIDPKSVLHQAILKASAASGRRLKRKKRDLTAMKFRLTDLIEEYRQLEKVPAFAAFLDELDEALRTLF